LAAGEEQPCVMTKAKALLWLSALLLAMSFFALAASFKVEWASVVFPAAWVIHFGVLAVLVPTRKVWRNLRNRSWRAALRTSPRWLLALGVVVIVAVAAAWPTLMSQFTQTTDTGVPVTQYEISSKKGRYFLQQNFGTPQEISKEEYQELWRQLNQCFAAAWIVLSYAGLCFWQVAFRLESEQWAHTG